MWDGAADEKDMLDATEDLVKRALVKARLSYDDLPGSVKELLDEIKTRRAELNYKALIMSAMKKHASGHNRKSTWTRKSKRFGNIAPGTKVGDLPRLNLYLDTSGSISIEELNEFLEIVDNFLKVGARKCDISFFHTNNYGHQQYKMGNKISRDDIQSGGTELTPVMEDILRKQADLNIVITDGCYGDVTVDQRMRPGQKYPQTLFIISKHGTEDHPLKRYGETVKVPDTESTKGRR
jgi:predicted metal-dependent peptidase